MTIKYLASMKTVNNNSISFLNYESDSADGLNILFLGTMHGEEPQGDFLINKFIERIKEQYGVNVQVKLKK